jgi:hypothetical protein
MQQLSTAYRGDNKYTKTKNACNKRVRNSCGWLDVNLSAEIFFKKQSAQVMCKNPGCKELLHIEWLIHLR